MDIHIVKALFALYIVTVSLMRLMADNEYVYLTAMKKIWGRSRGLLFHFLSNVIMPMLFAIYFLSRGVVGSFNF